MGKVCGRVPMKTKSVKSPNIQLLDHCLLCLRKTTASDCCDGGEGVVPKAVETTGLLSTFNLIWPYLTLETGAEKRNTVPDFEEVMTGRFKCSKTGKMPSSSSPAAMEFESLPTICQGCAGYVRQVEDLMESIRGQIQILKEIVQGRKKNGHFSEEKIPEPSDDFDSESVCSEDIKDENEDESISDPVSKGADVVADEENDKNFDDDDDADDPDYIKSEDDDSEDFWSDEEEMKIENSLTTEKEDPLGDSHSSKELAKKAKKQQRSCDLCGDQLPVSQILSHIQGHIGDYAVQCPNAPCPYVCSNTITLIKNHQRLCHFVSAKDVKKKQQYICETCGFTTDQRLSLRGHLQRNHERNSTKTFPCPLPNCGKLFAVRQSVGIHLSTHNLRPVTQQKCDLCEKSIPIQKISQHLQENHRVQEITSCRQCPCVFSTRLALVEHLFVHRYDKMSCDLCNNDVKYSRHSDLVRHYSSEHQLDCNRYTCEVCAKNFFTKSSLYTHKRITCSTTKDTKSKDPKKFPCDSCFGSVSFTNEPSLISHKIRVHGEDPFTCASCPKTFSCRIALSRHEKEHAGVEFQKEFKCDVEGCGKVCTKKKNLKLHMVTHGVGGIKCNSCEKRFATAPRLQIHHDAVHLKLRPYVCETCGEGFSSGTSLKKHNLVHTGDRPFSCDRCGQKFRHKEVLKRHLESHEKKGDAFKPMGPMKNVRKRKSDHLNH